MPTRLHAMTTNAVLFAVWFTVFALSGCAASSAQGAAQYFEGNALALANASERGDANEVRRLIKDKGVDPDVEFAKRDGIPLLAWPLRTRSVEGLRAMLDNGADPNARQVREIDGKPFKFNNAMVYAVRLEDPAFLQLLLKHGGDPNTRSSGGETLLFQAFINGNQWKNVQQLVEAGAKVNENNLGKADTVLSWYTARGGFDAAYWLLEHGADPTLSAPAASGSNSPARQIMVEDIYWEITTPDLLPWQKKCQEWLVERNIPRPPMPEHIRKKREAFKFPSREEDVPLL
jgi:ankyrin repeat protein